MNHRLYLLLLSCYLRHRPHLHANPTAGLSPSQIGVPDYGAISGLGGLGGLGSFHNLGDANLANMQSHLSAQVRLARRRGTGAGVGWGLAVAVIGHRRRYATPKV